MQKIFKSLPTAFMMTAMLASAVIVPSEAFAASHRAKARHFTAARTRGTFPANAFGSIPGGSGYSGPSNPGYGYGYGDNSRGCSACAD
jgi:hypothetical protein